MAFYPTFYLASILAFYLTYILTFYLAFFQAFYLEYILAFFLASGLTFFLACVRARVCPNWSGVPYKAIGSGPVHAQIALELAIGLLERDCPTWAGTCWSGARWCPQWKGRWRGGGGGRRRKGRAEAPLLKSRDPHRPSPGRWGTRQTKLFKTF